LAIDKVPLWSPAISCANQSFALVRSAISLGSGWRRSCAPGALAINRTLRPQRFSLIGSAITVVCDDEFSCRLTPSSTLVDARLMKNASASLSRVDERLVEMQNG
jgi:hypothetical protein